MITWLLGKVFVVLEGKAFNFNLEQSWRPLLESIVDQQRGALKRANLFHWGHGRSLHKLYYSLRQAFLQRSGVWGRNRYSCVQFRYRRFLSHGSTFRCVFVYHLLLFRFVVQRRRKRVEKEEKLAETKHNFRSFSSFIHGFSAVFTHGLLALDLIGALVRFDPSVQLDSCMVKFHLYVEPINFH